MEAQPEWLFCLQQSKRTSLKRFLQLCDDSYMGVCQVERKGMACQGKGIAWKYERPSVSKKPASQRNKGVRSLWGVPEEHWGQDPSFTTLPPSLLCYVGLVKSLDLSFLICKMKILLPTSGNIAIMLVTSSGTCGCLVNVGHT